MMVSLVFDVAGVEPPSRLRRRDARTSLGTASFPILALSVGAASAASVTYYDPAEAEFRTDQVNPNPAPVTLSAPAAQTVSVYDPAEAEFTQVPVPQAGPVITTHAPAAPARNGGWDPADN